MATRVTHEAVREVTGAPAQEKIEIITTRPVGALRAFDTVCRAQAWQLEGLH